MGRPRKCECGTCKRCKRREYMRAYYHRPKDSSYSSGGSVTVACAGCGEPVERTARMLASKGDLAYCTRECKDLARKRALKDEREQAKPERRCAHCGEEMPRSMRSDAKFCSEKCNSAAHALWSKMAKRAKVSGPRKTKIRRVEIADRDKWRCGICGGRIAQGKTHPDPGCLSIDHIVPISEGGTNDPWNLRAVHLRCNLSRRDRGGTSNCCSSSSSLAA